MLRRLYGFHLNLPGIFGHRRGRRLPEKPADVPVWLLGTSAGTWSAARGAIGASRNEIATGAIDGLVLTSTVTRVPPGQRQ